MARMFKCDICKHTFPIQLLLTTMVNTKDGYKGDIIAEAYLDLCQKCTTLLVKAHEEIYGQT